MKHQYRPSILNGALLGFALVLGVWGMDVIQLLGIPVPLQYPSLLVSGLGLVLLGGLTGWVTGHSEKVGWVVVGWLITSMVMAMVIFNQPTFGRTVTVWLAAPRFWGKPIYPFIPSLLFIIFTNLFSILLLFIFALLQNYRLSTIKLEMDEQGHFSGRGWFLLSLPLPLIFIAGLVTGSLVPDSTMEAVQKVQRVIERVRDIDGDLFELGLKEHINYGAIDSVRDQLAGAYTLTVGSFNPATATSHVTAHFVSGAWVKCRIINDQLSFCDDASPPFTTGLRSLVSGEEASPDCRRCLPKVTQEWQRWLEARQEKLGAAPLVSYQAHWGDFVLMRVDSAETSYAIECWFKDEAKVTLTSCAELDE